MKKIIALFHLMLTGVVLCSAQTQLPESGGFRQEGTASWYGEEFQGRQTASGELFDPKQFTAAHPTLPFGTVLTVTNLANNNQVQVRVNDRGPFVPSRIIDVSKAAAEKLDMLATGTAQVLIEMAPRTYAPISPDLPAAEAQAASGNRPDGSANLTAQSQDATQAPQGQSYTAAAPQAPVRQSAAPAPSSAPRTTVTATPAAPRVPAPAAAAYPQAPVTNAQRPVTTTARSAVPVNPAAPVNPVVTPTPPPATPTQIAPVQSTQSTWRPPVSPSPQLPQPQAPAPVPVPTSAPVAAPVVAPAPVASRPALPVTSVPQVSPAPQPVPAPVPTPAPVVSQQPPKAAEVSAPKTQHPPSTILGGPIVPGRIYRIQVGSFKEASNAMKTYNKLITAGFNPQWERYEGYFRVVLTGVHSEDIPVVAAKLGAAGFVEAVARLEGVEAIE